MIAAERIARLRRKAKLQELMVLVWGPGDPGPHGPDLTRRYWHKRNQIRAEIKKTFPHAEVYFSEDTALRVLTSGLRTALDEELLQAAAADCILVLDVSRGASVEVDRFAANPLIASKMTVLIPQHYVGGTGLVSIVHDETNVTGFTDEDFATCRVAREIAVQIVETVALNRLLSNAPAS